MEHISSHSCSINDGDSVVITGGAGKERGEIEKRVTRYNKDKWVEDMPNLNKRRKDHACGMYYNLNEKVNTKHSTYNVHTTLYDC